MEGGEKHYEGSHDHFDGTKRLIHHVGFFR